MREEDTGNEGRGHGEQGKRMGLEKRMGRQAGRQEKTGAVERHYGEGGGNG